MSVSPCTISSQFSAFQRLTMRMKSSPSVRASHRALWISLSSSRHFSRASSLISRSRSSAASRSALCASSCLLSFAASAASALAFCSAALACFSASFCCAIASAAACFCSFSCSLACFSACCSAALVSFSASFCAFCASLASCSSIFCAFFASTSSSFLRLSSIRSASFSVFSAAFCAASAAFCAASASFCAAFASAASFFAAAAASLSASLFAFSAALASLTISACAFCASLSCLYSAASCAVLCLVASASRAILAAFCSGLSSSSPGCIAVDAGLRPCRLSPARLGISPPPPGVPAAGAIGWRLGRRRLMVHASVAWHHPLYPRHAPPDLIRGKRSDGHHPQSGMTATPEEWRAVPGVAGLEVSSEGRVRRYHRGTGWSQRHLVPQNMLGYRRFTHNGVHMSVHYAVCVSFHGPQPTTAHTPDHLAKYDGDWKRERG